MPGLSPLLRPLRFFGTLLLPTSGVACLMTATPAAAESGNLSSDLQCVPYARQLSGIQIYGDAHTWWNQAEGSYARGSLPRPGAVMALRPHGAMQLGHVAYVSRVVDAREIRLHHANWSRIDGRRGQIERDVKAVDVSPANDWSEVRIWYTPIGALGTTHYPVSGFIYPDAPPPEPQASPQRHWAKADAKPLPSEAQRRAFAQNILPDNLTKRPGTKSNRMTGAPHDLIGELIDRHSR